MRANLWLNCSSACGVVQASVTFLPILQEPCTFDLLVYTDTSADVPEQWENSDPKFISDSTEVCPMPVFAVGPVREVWSQTLPSST